MVLVRVDTSCVNDEADIFNDKKEAEGKRLSEAQCLTSCFPRCPVSWELSQISVENEDKLFILYRRQQTPHMCLICLESLGKCYLNIIILSKH